MFRRLIGILFTFISGCTVYPTDQSRIHQFVFTPLLKGEQRQLSQHLIIEFRDQKHDLIAASLISEDELRVSLLSPEGVSLVDVVYDGVKVSSKIFLETAIGMPPQALIADIQLTYWPIDQLRENLPSSWDLREVQSNMVYQRQLLIDGVINTEVNYSSSDVWNAQIVLEQKVLGYKLSIRNLWHD